MLVGLHQGLCRVAPRQRVEQERAKVVGLAQCGALLQQGPHLCRASAADEVLRTDARKREIDINNVP